MAQELLSGILNETVIKREPIDIIEESLSVNTLNLNRQKLDESSTMPNHECSDWFIREQSRCKIVIKKEPVDAEQAKSHNKPNFIPIEKNTSVMVKKEQSEERNESNEGNYTVNSASLSVNVPLSFRCKQCSKCFTNEKSLTSHSRKAHSIVPASKGISCVLCSEIFSCRRDLTSHFDSAHDGFRYECGRCSKTFVSKESLKSHISAHDNCLFQCDTCKKSFSTAYLLNGHMKLHKGLIPKCKICSKSFTRRGNLYQHLRIHQNIFNYKCSLCSKAYSTKWSLNRHKKFHKKPEYKCNICSRTFFRRDCLKSHQANICLNEEKISRRVYCAHCSRSFRSKSWLRKHLQSHWTMEDETSSTSVVARKKCTNCNESFLQERFFQKHLKYCQTLSNALNVRIKDEPLD